MRGYGRLANIGSSKSLWQPLDRVSDLLANVKLEWMRILFLTRNIFIPILCASRCESGQNERVRRVWTLAAAKFAIAHILRMVTVTARVWGL
jgi:hypothetical protein